MASGNTIPSNIVQSTGPLVLGYILNWGFQGALCVQVYYYYMAFPKDRISSKSLVFGLFLLETVQSILVAHDMFGAFATGYGNLEALADAQLTWLGIPMMTGIASCTVQIFFAYRIYSFSGSKIAGIIIIALALMQTAAAFVGGVQILKIGDLTKLQRQTHVSTTVWLTGSAVCDIIIATFMTYFLSRRQTDFKATQVLISRISRLTIETGSMTASVAIIDLVLFLIFSDNNFHTTPALMLGKLYAITLVTTLNARLRIVNGRNDDSTTNVVHSFQFGGSGEDADGIRRRRTLGVESERNDDTVVTVNIEREVWRSDIRMSSLGVVKEENDVSDVKGLA